MSRPLVRKALLADSRHVARLHRETISWGLLSQLGEDVVTAFYQAIVGSPAAFCLVAERDGSLDGFVTGVTDWRRLFRDIIRIAWWPVLKGAHVLIRQARWRRLWETSRYAQSKHEGVDAEFLSVGVREEAEGRLWTAAALMYAGMEEFRRRGVSKVRGVAWEHNERAIRFFEAVGLRRVSEVQIHPGEKSLTFMVKLAGSEAKMI